MTRPSPADVLLPAFVAVIGTVEIFAAGYQPRWLSCATVLVAALVLAFGRMLPLAAPLMVTAIYVSAPLLGVDTSQPASWALLIASVCFSTGLYAPRPRRVAGLACVLGTVVMAMAGLTWFTDFHPNALFGLIMSVGPWTLGVALRRTLDQNRHAAAQAERARVESVLAGQRAAKSLRERIAVELSDVLAHSVGAMLLQSSAAGDLVRRDPAAAARTLHAAAGSGREALAETGRMLRVLREDSDGPRLRPEPAVASDAAPPTPRPLNIHDLALPALIGAVATIEISSGNDGHAGASVAACLVAVVLLCARRLYPLVMPTGVIAVALGAPLMGADTEDPASWILIVALACFAAGRQVPRSRTTLGLVSVLGPGALCLATTADRGDVVGAIVFLFSFAIGPWAAGVALRTTLERTRRLATATERARLDRDLDAERAADAERRRIARELHDVLANSLTIMVIQASLAADLVVENPQAASEAVSLAEQSGRAALGETGRLIGLIHDGSDAYTTHPQHGATDIPTLATEYIRAGLTVAMELDTAGRLPAGVDLSIYHIVQEALTNVLKHAPGSPVRVRLSRTPSEVAVEIHNGRAPRLPVCTAPSGHGLTGMRERVSMLGGSLDAQPTPEGGFRLTATMPLAEAS